MARSIPPIERAESNSDAEMAVLKALVEQLDDSFLVLHSVAWVSSAKHQPPSDGETDFLICHPKLGLLAIEVKGGHISLDYSNRDFYSTDRYSNRHSIKNPFDQARRGKHQLLAKLKANPEWRKLNIDRFCFGYACLFPDTSSASRLSGPDANKSIIGDSSDMMTLKTWVKSTFQYWTSSEAGPSASAIGTRGVEIASKLFSRVVSTQSLLSSRLKHEEDMRITLTSQQAKVLDFLRKQRRVIVSGGAGTGKTLIALERAKRSAFEGQKTLFLCYNRPLADHVRECVSGTPNLTVASFHQVADRWIIKAGAILGRDLVSEAKTRDPKGDLFLDWMPAAFNEAIIELGGRYGAIIVDEAQDFADSFWMPVELLQADPETSLLYVFIDENQNLYKRSSAIPIGGEPVSLDKNCRNTKLIHDAAYQYYKGSQIEAPEIVGVDITKISERDTLAQSRAICRLIVKLTQEEEVPAHDIAILICEGSKKEELQSLLKAQPFPKSIKLANIEGYRPNVLTVDTVARFKGLERAVIILWGFDGISVEEHRETFYVGMSRAKSVLYLVGQAANGPN